MTLPPNTFQHKTPMILDVSSYENVPLNWGLVQPRPAAVICKASEGTWHKDSALDRFYISLKNAGIPRGAYHYFWGNYDGAKQAYWFLKCLGGEIGEIAPTIDVEKRDYRDTHGRWVRMPRGASAAANIQKFLDVIEKETGKICMFYTSENWVWEYLTNQWLGKNYLSNPMKYPLWLAQYPYKPDLQVAPYKLPKGWTRWALWQYSEAGVLGGFPYDGVDLNVPSDTFGIDIPIDPIDPFPKLGKVTELCSPYLNVRIGAGIQYAKVTPSEVHYPGEELVIYEVEKDLAGNEWARIGDGKWSARIYGGAVWITYVEA